VTDDNQQKSPEPDAAIDPAEPTLKGNDAAGQQVDDEDWQEDRPVFEREPVGPEKGKIVVTARARKHWSDKNVRKFTPETALKIVQFVSAGCFIETAAGAAGLNKSTLYEWMKRGENRKDPRSTEELRAWKKLLDEAAATAEARAVAGIQEAGAGGAWQAYAWFLERKYPDRWRARTSNEVTVKNSTTLPLDPETMDYVETHQGSLPPGMTMAEFLARCQATVGVETKE
jgi:hypothetical protein